MQTPDQPDCMLLQADRTSQETALAGVSRTLARTIPQLPEPLRQVTTTAYLVCRAAEALETHCNLSRALKQSAFEWLAAAVEGERDSELLSQQLLRQLNADAPAGERELIRNLPRILRLASTLPPPQRSALARCVRTQCTGISRFETLKGPAGLADFAQFEEYCYHLAGSAGELLAALVCDELPALAAQRQRLLPLSRDFGQGLQMTRILANIWADRARGVCWLPRDVFVRHGCALQPGLDWAVDPGFHSGLDEMIAIARAQLRSAQRFTLLIPREEAGLRRFCCWATGMALLALRRVRAARDLDTQAEISISRRQLARVMRLGAVAAKRDWSLRSAFWLAERGLPAPLYYTSQAASETPPLRNSHPANNG